VSEDWTIENLKAKILDIVTRCRNCAYCEAVCPLFESTRGLLVQSPHGILETLYYAIIWNELKRENKQALRDILYACSTCFSCVLQCKISAGGVPLLDGIEAGRKLLVELMLGPMPEQINILESIRLNGNPYSKPASTRLNWLKELAQLEPLNYKILPKERSEILFFAGCAASYDLNLKNIVHSIVKLLEVSATDYGVLSGEWCCGCSARRMGEEGLFEEVSRKNMEAFIESGIKEIITVSPHCYNTFRNEYSGEIREITIKHYTEFFADLVKRGNLTPKLKVDKIVTYHDPCYLGKRNGVYDAPRRLISSIPGIKLVEMKRNRDNSLCCGGGGGRMWIDVEEINRLSETRVKEALEVGAEVIATACPWCHSQLEDAVKTTGSEGKVEVKDVAELLGESVG
jgi:Fe-S oxidoreductase